MQSGNKWKQQMKREKLSKQEDNNKDYRKDDTLEGEGSPLLKIIATVGILSAGIIGYRKGLFKEPSKKFLELADSYGKRSTNLAPTIRTFNKWANASVYETKYTSSLLRAKPKLSELTQREGLQTILSDTKGDVLEFVSKRKSSIEYLEKSKRLGTKTYYDTELVKELKTMNSIVEQLEKEQNGINIGHTARTLMSENLYSSFKITEEKAKKQIATNGYRNLTLDDIIRVVSDKDGTRKVINKRADFKLDETSTSLIDDFLKGTMVGYTDDTGKSVKGALISSNKWKDFKVDAGLRISEEGRIIDTRYANKNSSEFIRSLSNDYKVPLLNFNPLKFFGLDKVGYKKSRFGIIHQSTVQNVLTNVPGRKTLKETGKFGNKALLFVDGDVFKFGDTKAANAEKIASNLIAERIPTNLKRSGGLRSDLNYYRKMVGLNTKEFEMYGKEDGFIKEAYSNIARKLDIGFQDRDIQRYGKKVVTTPTGVQKEITISTNDGLFDVDNMRESIYDWIKRKVPSPAKDVKEKVQVTQLFGNVGKDQDLYLLRHKDTKVRDIINNKDVDTISQYFREIFAGRNDIKNISGKGTFVYSLADRLNQTLSNVGLGLGMDSIGSTTDTLSNLVLKRFLPIYGAYQTMQYVTYLSERDNQNRGNIQKDIAEAFKVVDLGFHKVKDILGITSFAKGLTEIMPGSDSITELPGVSGLALEQSYKERKKYYESGMVAVRKGRYWELGNSPFVGGKVQYWKPNLYRRIKGDVMFTDSKYGSRKEYFDNAWFSSPIKHFVTDKYHYEKKHYYDRPYPVTTPEFANVPIIGDILSGTVGKVVKPQRIMHPEYFTSQGSSKGSEEKFMKDLEINNKVGNSIASSDVKISSNAKSLGGASVDIVTGNSNNNDGVQPILYTTTSGQSKIYSIDKDTNLNDLRQDLKENSINKIDGALPFSINKKEEDVILNDVNVPGNLKTTLASQYTNLTNLTGMTGYITESFLTGTPMKNAKMLDNASYAMGFNKTFWDQEIGGIGGELSEIFRRFIPDKNKDFEYINPIKNNMPSWMPSEDYFVDFTRGDPMTKVKWGEGRLPGEGYERLWDIDNESGNLEDYSLIDRVRILGDVAPYSNEYAEQSKLLREEFLQREEEISRKKKILNSIKNKKSKEAMELENDISFNKSDIESQKEELKAIEERASAQKQPLRVYDYKFKTANLIEKKVEIDKVINNDTFTVKGEEDVAYTLGGISVKQPDTAQGKRDFDEYISSTLKEGNKITLKLDPDELKSKPSGINSSIKSIVEDDGKMINRELVKRGFASLKEDDDSPIGVNVRHSAFSRTFGSIWESFAHMDTYFHTKFLQVRSPLEHYKRNVVYGEDFQEWNRPVENFLKPTVNKLIERPAGLLIAPVIGSMFGRTKAAKLVGATVGLSTVLVGKTIAKTSEIATGDTWKPKTRRKEEQLDEYIDKLKYVKNMKLYNEYKTKALEEDGFDLDEYRATEDVKAQKRKARVRKLESAKKDINYQKTTVRKYVKDNKEFKLTDEQKNQIREKESTSKKEVIKLAAKSFVKTKGLGNKLDVVKEGISSLKEINNETSKREEKAMMKNINSQINEINTKRDIDVLPENALRALEYYDMAEQTVYGYDPGDSIQNLMKAIPKNEKDFFRYFVDAPEEERGEILDLVPNYLKNAMMGMWGKHTTEKEPLVDYFSNHQLPGEEWIGWDENVSLDNVKVKLVKKENLETSNFNIWNDDIESASQQEIPIPHISKKYKKNQVHALLKKMLEESGYENVQIQSKSSLTDSINLNVKNDMKPYADKKIREEGIF